MLLVIAFAADAQDKKEQPRPADHKCGVMKRGEKAMGFSPVKTTHHFLLLEEGGAIQVTANGGSDTASRDQIREHLSHIAKMFAAGNFDTPMFIHGVTPPGVPVMIRLRDQIIYRYEEMERGARVRITTTNPQALDAIHGFLRFQITDHHTGDSPNAGGDKDK